MPDSLRVSLEAALGSQYSIQRLLGRGGMGAVYLATERSLERSVAIKVLAPEMSATVDSTERFRREARIAAQLAHPNIVPLYAFGEVDGLWYYVMGHVRGGSLAERLSFEGTLPWEAVSRVVAEIADALDYAHRQGVIHRDIKPANVLLEDESGRAMLTDFGIARNVDTGDRLTITGLVVGTPHYMSPEQAMGAREIDGRSDIYSLGVLAYEMLTGREPFADDSLRQAAAAHTTRAPKRLDELVPGIPPNLAAVIERCLAIDPDARWPDARSLKRALGHDDTTETAAPAELRDLPGFGTLALLWGVMWGGLAVVNRQSREEAWLCALLSLLVPIGLLLDVWSIKRRGLRAREIMRVMFWPPMWWGLWWPRSLRRRGDLWDRLPAIARAARMAITSFVFGAPLLLVLAHIPLPAAAAEALAARPWWFAAAAGVLIGGLLGALGTVAWWGRARGLSVLEMVRLVHGPTIVSTYWTTPTMADLLRMHQGGHVQPPSRPGTPHDLLRAIYQLAESVKGDARRVVDDAATGARRLVAWIEQLDAEIAALERDVNPNEIARLDERLAMMGDSSSDSDEVREMRHVLLRQRDILKRMRAQFDLAAGRRAHLVGLLQRLWARLAERAAPGVNGGRTSEGLDGQLRAVCAEVGEQADDAEAPHVADASDATPPSAASPRHA